MFTKGMRTVGSGASSYYFRENWHLGRNPNEMRKKAMVLFCLIIITITIFFLNIKQSPIKGLCWSDWSISFSLLLYCKEPPEFCIWIKPLYICVNVFMYISVHYMMPYLISLWVKFEKLDPNDSPKLEGLLTNEGLYLNSEE